MRHGLKNSLIPVVTVLGLQMAGLLGGAIIIEQIFTLPGLGQYTFIELFNKDFDVVQTMTLYVGIVVDPAEPRRRRELRVARSAHPVLVGG